MVSESKTLHSKKILFTCNLDNLLQMIPNGGVLTVFAEKVDLEQLSKSGCINSCICSHRVVDPKAGDFHSGGKLSHDKL